MRRLLLADLGDIDTGVAVPALAERYAAAVVTLALDVGQPGLAAACRARALGAGAVRAHLIDARDAFARDYLLRLLHAGALAPDDLAVPAALLRTLVAAKLVEVAAMEGISLVAHGCPDQAGADHLARSIGRLEPELFVVPAGAPRLDPAPVAGPPALWIASTLWWRQLPAAIASGSAPLTPAATATLDVRFAGGTPVALNGIEMPLVELIEAVDTIAGDHGVGRFALRPPTADGVVLPLEAPAAAVLTTAHEALTSLAISPTLRRLRRHMARRQAALLRDAAWGSDTRRALDAFAAGTQQGVDGTVRLQLRRGRCRVLARTLAAPGPATPQAAAAGTRARDLHADVHLSH